MQRSKSNNSKSILLAFLCPIAVAIWFGNAAHTRLGPASYAKFYGSLIKLICQGIPFGDFSWEE